MKEIAEYIGYVVLILLGVTIVAIIIGWFSGRQELNLKDEGTICITQFKKYSFDIHEECFEIKNKEIK